MPAEDRVVAGRYSLRRVVGRGGMGVLWAAQDQTLGREVAVKEIRRPVDATGRLDEVVRERGLREARAAARVTHPNAVTVYDVVEEDGRPWIVMELLPPRTLGDVLTEEGPLSPREAARLGLDLLDALCAAHEVGVLHRDVKPANILFGEDGRPVLVDFGIATVDDDATLTATGMLLGSPAFMAPERARGERPTPASDLWSLGATLFTAVEGQSPFRRDGHLPTLAAVVTQDAPPAEHAGPLRPLLAALLARDPSDRPSTERTRAMLVAALSSAGAARWASDAVTDELAEPTFDHLEATVEAPAVQPEPTPMPTPAAPALLRQRRVGALAAALLAPVTVFALASGLPMPWEHVVPGTPPAAASRAARATAPPRAARTATTAVTPATVKVADVVQGSRQPASTMRSSSVAGPGQGHRGKAEHPRKAKVKAKAKPVAKAKAKPVAKPKGKGGGKGKGH